MIEQNSTAKHQSKKAESNNKKKKLRILNENRIKENKRWNEKEKKPWKWENI